MFVDQFYIECLSQASFLVGEEESGQAIVIDPRRDVDEFVEAARHRGVDIVGVINTHFHADFVAGHLELAERTGAWIGYGARADADYPICALKTGDVIGLGNLSLEVLETPGHTWESISLLARDHGRPVAVFTGDTLFNGDIGRPDLAASVGAIPSELAHAQYDSIHRVIAGLPDDLLIYPSHGAGSACGKNLSPELVSQLSYQKRSNWALLEKDEDKFVDTLTSGQPAIPQYFSTAAVLNRRSRPIMASAPTLVLRTWAS